MLEWAQTGALAVLAGVGYRHIMAAFDRARARDDAMGKRLVSYETSNNQQHSEIIDRLSHVEALVNGKGT